MYVIGGARRAMRSSTEPFRARSASTPRSTAVAGKTISAASPSNHAATARADRGAHVLVVGVDGLGELEVVRALALRREAGEVDERDEQRYCRADLSHGTLHVESSDVGPRVRQCRGVSAGPRVLQ
jgi:hypothetical protein